MNQASFVLVTSAFNEERYIEKTLRSVVAQSVLPARWVIVSDGSTDGTDELILNYQKQYGFITYLRVDHDHADECPVLGRVAMRKVQALSRGLAMIPQGSYDYIGNVDADVSFAEDFFEKLLARFCGRPKLGIAGGFIYDVINGRLVPHFVNPQNVGGPMQFFRAACFQEIDGYVPYGHEDTIALFMARMHGWETESFPELKVQHHKSEGCHGWRRLKAKYRLGAVDYALSDTLIWEILRCAKEVKHNPYLVGSCLRIAGYLKAVFTQPKLLPPDLQEFRRREQYQVLKGALYGRL